jgi:hypothetical protein
MTVYGVVRELVGAAESYTDAALVGAAYQALWRSGEFRFPPDILFLDNFALAGAGGLTVDVVKAA